MESKLTFYKEQLIHLKSLISEILESEPWNKYNHEAYKIISNYYESFSQKNKKYESNDDISIIKKNITDQIWYIKSKEKSMINLLLNKFAFEYTLCEKNITSNVFLLRINFSTFMLYVNFYNNLITHTIDYCIYIEDIKTNKRAYICYYIYSPIMELKQYKLNVPDIDNLYKVMNIDKNLLSTSSIICLLSEIIFYYDNYEFLKDIQITFNTNVTLKYFVSSVSKL